jgi:hypothetical protein
MHNKWTPDTLKTDLSIRVRSERWCGQPVLRLAYFDQLRKFAEALTTCASIRFDLSYRGNAVLGATLYSKGRKFLDNFSTFMSVFAHAREIAKHFNINPAAPRTLTEAHIHEIMIWHTFLTKGELRRRIGKGELKIELNEPYWNVIEETIRNQEPSFPFAFGHNEIKGHLLDQEFDLGNVDLEFTHIVISNDERERLRENLAKRHSPLQFECMTMEDCESIIRLPAPPPASAEN